MIFGQGLQESESSAKILLESETRVKRIRVLFANVTSILFILVIGLVLYFSADSSHIPEKAIQQNDSTEYYSKIVETLRKELKDKPQTAEVLFHRINCRFFEMCILQLYFI